MRSTSPGHILYALAMLGIGVLTLVYRDFALQWQPVPADFPAHTVLAALSGVFLLITALGTLVPRLALPSALLLAAYWLFWTLLRLATELLHLAAPVGQAIGVAEDLVFALGAALLVLALSPRPGLAFLRILFGLCCLVFGLAHFVYAGFTAAMIPAWMPARLWLAYATGAGHAAAGAALLAMVLPRLAVTLEAAMMSSFVLLVHIPSIDADPAPFWGPDARTRIILTFVALGLSGAAWLLAAALRGLPWGVEPKPAPAS
jgi:uncharacterized membrane protein